MLIAAFAASTFFVWLIIPTELNILRIFLLCMIATIVEACSPKEIDNILIPCVILIAASV